MNCEGEVELLRGMAQSAVVEEAERLKRVGQVCPGFCFACGRATGDLAHCDCDFPTALHCAGAKMLCPECRTAHRAVAKHLTGMFAHPPVRRVDALRARKFRFLRNALAAISEQFHDKAATALKRELSVLDSYLDPSAEFRRDVLDVFSGSTFSRWAELAEELRREEHDYYIEAVITSGIFGK